LLVAKSIVRAVHNQEPNGRFLELQDKESNIWQEIDNKKAVDKSSQALRERWDESDDDDVLQRSMTIMFNKKLALNSQGRASRDSVEEAVYFAVISVALEYAKRWGTKGVASLTEQLRPIVKSVGSKAIPRPNGELPPSKVVDLVAVANVEASRSESTLKKWTTSVKTTGGPMVATNTSAISTKAAKKKSRSKSVTPRLPVDIQPKPTALANNGTSTLSARSGSAHQVLMIPGSSPVPPMNPSEQVMSHNFPSLTSPFIDQANSAPVSKDLHPMYTGDTSASTTSIAGDTFGSLVPRHLMTPTSQNVHITRERTSNQQPQQLLHLTPSAATVQDYADDDIQTDSRRSENSDTFAQVINHNVLHLSQSPTPTPNDSTQKLPSNSPPTPPINSNQNGFNTAKRKLSNIATQQEIEADDEKTPKFHGMSPFHREILKMNLQSLVDW
jgi:hypothetical protein